MKTKTSILSLATAIALGVVSLNLLPSRSQAQAQRFGTPPVEQYKVVGVADDDPAGLEAKLNKVAADGWKLRTSFNADQFRGLIFAK